MNFGYITEACQPSKEKVLKSLREKIMNGSINVGKMIVPRKVTKMILSKDGIIKQSTNLISGRKIQLIDVRRKILAMHSQYMWLTTDQAFG